MIPEGRQYNARLITTYYINGQIVSEYAVLIPDHTISGNFRRERVTLSLPAILTTSDTERWSE